MTETMLNRAGHALARLSSHGDAGYSDEANDLDPIVNVQTALWSLRRLSPSVLKIGLDSMAIGGGEPADLLRWAWEDMIDAIRCEDDK